ncbi:MAG: hypothetical protein ACTSR8_01845 [Promethearchaeota archaeon]
MVSEEYIVEDIKINEDQMQFKVKKLNPLGWLLVLILAVIPLAIVLPIFQFALLWVAISFTAAIIIAPILWRVAGKSVLNSLFIKDFQDWKDKKGVSSLGRKIFNAIIGVKINEDYLYYLEGRVEDLNLNKIKVLLTQRIFNVTSASLGIGYTVATILRFAFPKASAQYIMGVSLILILLAPLMLFWFIPMIWSIQDANIKYKDELKDIGDLSYRISKSTIRKFIGITGITLAFSFFLDSQLLAEQADSLIQRYILASLWVILVIALNIGVSLVCGSIYLNFHHQKVVNNFREKLASTLDIGVTSVRKLSEEEKQYFK